MKTKTKEDIGRGDGRKKIKSSERENVESERGTDSG